MNRPDWNETFMDMCHVLARKSTCAKLQTATVITIDNRIITIGYNGTPTGNEHCYDYWHAYWTSYFSGMSFPDFLRSDEFLAKHHEYSAHTEIHAESNAILFGAKNGIKLIGASLYTIYSPCIQCSKEIVTVGIKRVYYNKVYSQAGLLFLSKNNVELYSL